MQYITILFYFIVGVAVLFIGFITTLYVKNYYCFKHRRWKETIHVRQQGYKCVCRKCVKLKA